MKKIYKILIVVATQAEVAPLLQAAQCKLMPNRMAQVWHGSIANHSLNVLVTGVGAMHTAFAMSSLLAGDHFDWAANLGIAGSYTLDLGVGSTVQVVSDIFADVGAESPNGFISLNDLAFFDAQQYPYQQGQLYNPQPLMFASLAALPTARGATVQTTSGTAATIAQRTERNPQAHVETMESAAFFYACLQYRLPFVALRSISNAVEPRNTANWNIAAAIEALNTYFMQLLHEI